ncbi:MAG: TolC family protein [Marinifilaceae bacterium]
MRRRVMMFISALFLPCMLSAQTTEQKLTLKQAADYAIEHNKELQVSRKNVDLYRQKVTEAISQGLPQVGGKVNYSTNFGEKLDLGGMSRTLEDQAAATLSVSQLIFSGQWIVGVQTSKIAERMNMQQVDLTELDIIETVYNSYYTILVAERTLEILKQNLDNMEDVLKHTENMYKAGVSEITDVDQIRITVGQLQNSYLSTERTLDVNYNLLRIQLGFQAGTPIQLTQTLADFLDSGDYVRLAVKQFEIENNAQYQLMNTQEKLKDKMVGLKRWTYAPTIGASYSYQYQIKEGGFLNVPHSASVVMEVPIFSGFQRKAALQQAKIELSQTTLSKELLTDQLNLQNNQFQYQLKNAIENYNLQKTNIDVAKRVLSNIQHKFEHGVASSLDMTQANNNYLQAENNYNSACLNLLQAQTNIEKLYNILNQ